MEKALLSQLENTNPEFQNTLAYLLNFASDMGAYDQDSEGILAVISPYNGNVLITEKEARCKLLPVEPETGK